MKHLLLLAIILVIAFASCEKFTERGSYENPILKYHGDALVDIGTSIAETSDAYVVCGLRSVISRSENSNGGSYIDSYEEDMAVLLTDSEGDLNWDYTTGLAGVDAGQSIISLSDGSFVCTGVSTVSDGVNSHDDVVISKINSSGGIVWQNTYGGQGNQSGMDLIECDDQGFLIIGSTDASSIALGFGDDNPSGKMNVYLLKLNSQGDSLWSYSYGYEGDDYGKVIVNDVGGTGYMILATTDNQDVGQAQNNILFFRVNDAGNVTSNIIFGSSKNETASDVVLTEDGYVILGAAGNDNNSNTEIFALKLSQDIYSTPVFEKRITISGEKLMANSISYHPSGFYVIAGGIGDPQAEDMLFYFMDISGNEYVAPHIPAGEGSQIIYDAIVDINENIVAVGTNGTETSSLITFYKFEQPVK